MNQKSILFYLAIAWTVIILLGCSLPGDGLPPSIMMTDKLIHVVIFVLFGYLWRMAGYSVWWVLVAGMAYGLFTETWQGLLPVLKRSFDLRDALADTIGTIIGIAVAWGVRQVIKLF